MVKGPPGSSLLTDFLGKIGRGRCPGRRASTFSSLTGGKQLYFVHHFENIISTSFLRRNGKDYVLHVLLGYPFPFMPITNTFFLLLTLNRVTPRPQIHFKVKYIIPIHASFTLSFGGKSQDPASPKAWKAQTLQLENTAWLPCGRWCFTQMHTCRSLALQCLSKCIC